MSTTIARNPMAEMKLLGMFDAFYIGCHTHGLVGERGTGALG